MRVSTAAIYTFAALVARDLTQQAIAAPNPETLSDATTAEVNAPAQSDVAVVVVNSIAPTESIATPPLSSKSLNATPVLSKATGQESDQNLVQSDDSVQASGQEPDQNLVQTSVQKTDQNLVQAPDQALDQAPDQVASQVANQDSNQDSAETALTVASALNTPTSIAPPEHLTSPEDLTNSPLVQVTGTAGAAEHSGSVDRPSTRGMFDRTTDEATLMAQLIAQSTSSGLPTYAPVEPVGLPTDMEVEDLQRRLEEVPQTVEFGNVFQGSPAITISNPTGYGAGNLEVFAAIGFQSDVRYSDEADAGMSVGIGLGDASKIAGLQLSYTLASFGQNSRDFGSGGFNAKLYHLFDNGLGIAVGWEGFATTGDAVDFEDTVYGSLSYVIRTNPDFNAPFSRIALTAGVGNGRFRSEDAVNNDDNTVGVFGSLAARILPPLSAIVEWTGQDLAAGLSIAPIPNFPLVITPAVRDITGAGDGARFVIGMGVAFQL